ncbi:MAG: tRNA (adenosine(37)-N6)-threonylcarbamoyltransferase complex ATPase subunit type 1 TsaE [Alphaproteobacteria bacterium]|nr:tRNA (adenosine(37)-N6)-threonylcarbamoyltransferase complex ATPase subunit type 1 TsaE [Alphaproteobacteria bacterium]
MSHSIFTIDDLKKEAITLALEIDSPCCIALWGEMGAGKTTFAKFFIQALLGDQNADVPSPTFTLVQTYQTNKGELWHCDLYRLNDPEEIAELGLLEAFQRHICLVEWPENAGSFLPKKRLDIYLDFIDETTRSYRLEKPKCKEYP